MAVYTLQGPDGRTYQIEGPDGATAEQLGAFVQSQPKPAPAAQQVAGDAITKGAQANVNDASGVSQGALNLLTGAVRGAGSIGATLVAPYDMAKDAMAGKGLSLESNRQRRTDMDSALSGMGAQTDSLTYGAGKLGTEIAGTLAVPGMVAGAAGKAGGISPALIEAIRTGGMSAPGAGAVTRAAGGAINGAVSAGLVNPEDAPAGGAIGAAAPGVIKMVGAAGEKLGQRAAEAQAKALRNAPLRKTISDSVEAGYVIPPNMVKPGFANQVIESIAGKHATQQIASTKNSEVTGGLVRKALGMADDAPLSTGALEGIRKQAGKAYADIANLSPEAAADLEALKVARNESQAWFKAYNRSASPLDLAKAKEARETAQQLEQALEGHAVAFDKPQLIPALREARAQIAKTYTVARALTDSSGNVDARVLGRMYEKGSPLSGELETAGRFGAAFPTIAKSPEQIGSPAAHNMKALASALMGGGGLAAAGPAGLAAAAVPFVAPPAARALMFRQGAQKALVPDASKAEQMAKLAALLRNAGALESLPPVAPIAGAALLAP